MTATTVCPVLLLTGVVRRVERLSPSFARIRLGGAGFEHLGPEGPTFDQRVKLVVPAPGRPVPTRRIAAEDWYAGWLALPPEDRGYLRTYTARAVEGDGEERQLVVDFVLHGASVGEAAGPAGSWAANASVGDEIGVVAPRRGHEGAFGGIEFAPGPARRLVLVADETALPALASIVGSLPEEARGVAVIEVPGATDFLDVRFPPGIERHWLARGDRRRGSQTLATLRECLRLEVRGRVAGPDWPVLAIDPAIDPAGDTTDDPDDDVWETPGFSSSGDSVSRTSGEYEAVGPEDTYAWVAGDSDTVKACRRLLVGEHGMPRHHVAFMGYWKQGRAP